MAVDPQSKRSRRALLAAAAGAAAATVVGAVAGPLPAQTGIALQTVGRIKLASSGITAIPAGLTSVTVSPGVDVSAYSFVLLTPMAWFCKGGTTWKQLA